MMVKGSQSSTVSMTHRIEARTWKGGNDGTDLRSIIDCSVGSSQTERQVRRTRLVG
jgi:hypothetical protein